MERGIPRPTKFAHVVFATRRYQAMLHWYVTVFDARVQYQDAVATFLTFDDEHHRFLIANLDVTVPGQGSPDREGLVGVAHLAYSLADMRDLADHYVRLKSEGVFPFLVIHHGFTISMYYGDPDCNDIEFQVDLFDTPEAATQFMQSGALAANPIGVELDPDEFVRKVRAGVPHSHFVAQPSGPASPPRSSRTDPPIRPSS
jgi:catechol 2,3-dioxygenase-like lactoylglutathione lyase family enzyme